MSHRSRRILIGLGSAVALCGVYLWFFGFQTLMVVETRWMFRKTPVVWLTPRSLSTSSMAAGMGKKLSYFGYEFEVPWDDLDDSKTKVGTNWAVLKFHSGNTMKFTTMPPREFVNGILEMGTNKDSFRRLFGEVSLESDYAMWRLIAETTPDKVSFFSSRKDTAGIPMLLVMKAVAAPEDSGIFSLQTKDFKGFQWGDPEAHPKRIFADLFAEDGSLEFAFFGPGKEKPFNISQPEINRVLQTVHKVADGAPTQLSKLTTFAVQQ